MLYYLMMIKIVNDGQKIRETDYWESDHAQSGLFYLSWNAGAGRLLVPDSQKSTIREMRTGKCVIVSRGPWPEQGGREGLELLFEDESDNPFAIHLVSEQCDRLIPDADQGAGFDVMVWMRDGEKLRLPGKYRRVPVIPCLEPWSAH